jgi:DNA-binding LacI/PurR family transcriptional regulator
LYSYADDSFLTNPYYVPVINGINFMAQQNGKNPMLCSLRRPSDDGPSGIIRELANEVDGFVVIEPSTTGFNDMKKALKATDKPAVLLNYEAPDGQLDSVTVDNQESTRRMTEFLINNGHQKIAYVHIKSSFHDITKNPVYIKRLNGYKDAFIAQGIKPYENAEVNLKDHNDKEAVRGLFSQDNPPTALFCFDDATALALYKICGQLGLSVPGDVSIVGFDGIERGKTADPALTTVASPLMELGKASVQRILEKTGKNGSSYPQKVVLPGKIEERGSHKDIKSQTNPKSQ